jgi:CDP-diacylglycerol---glycerol-3-phosphate 3-phosphatidyltransferase
MTSLYLTATAPQPLRRNRPAAPLPLPAGDVAGRAMAVAFPARPTRIRTAMLNALRPYLTRLLTPVGEALARTPVTPNAITITGTCGMVAGALWLFPTGHLFAGTMVCTFFVVADMLDGVLARIKGTSGAWGAFLDSTLDRVSDAAVFAGLAIWLARTGQGPLAVVALFCLVAGLLVSYAKARAEGLGVRCDVGIAERTERLLIGLSSAGLYGLGVPYVLAIGLWVLAVLSAVTFGQRVYAVHAAIRAGDNADPAPGAAEQSGISQPPAGGTR